MGLFKEIGKFFRGTPGRYEQRSTLNPQQQNLFNQMQAALQGRGAGGAFGDVADYYRGNLSDNPADFEAFAAPEQRRFREEIIPGLSEQFAGMGSGALSSSGFRNAAVSAGADLSERLGALRAQLRQQAAQGLNQMGQFGLSPQFQENVYRAGQPGFIDYAGQALGNFGTQAGGNWVQNRFGNKRQDTSGIYANKASGYLSP